ncbi:MAG: hypothetical protein P4M13_08080 [Alphaproteobacteria bacterium]|nr:hypothetical protein [Alphaproteobacteria bacterium]
MSQNNVPHVVAPMAMAAAVVEQATAAGFSEDECATFVALLRRAVDNLEPPASKTENSRRS